jgi:hypothetical protein
MTSDTRPSWAIEVTQLLALPCSQHFQHSKQIQNNFQVLSLADRITELVGLSTAPTKSFMIGTFVSNIVRIMDWEIMG